MPTIGVINNICSLLSPTQKDPDDFLLQADNLDVDEFDDELNDETFGDPIGDLNDDWEAAQDQYNGRQPVAVQCGVRLTPLLNH